MCVCEERKIRQTDIDEIDRHFKYEEKIPIVTLKTK